MTKQKSTKQSGKSHFIDMTEISETLDSNEDVIKNLIHNYNHNMLKIGQAKTSVSKSDLIRTR